MTDETNLPIGSAGATVSQPEPPLPFQIPVQLLEQWIGLPQEHRVAAELTRQDVDNLVLGLLRSNDAQSAIERTLISWSNGDVQTANGHLNAFRRLNSDSQNHIRQFFTGLLASLFRSPSG